MENIPKRGSAFVNQFLEEKSEPSINSDLAGIQEKGDIIKDQNNNLKDRILQIKIRENIFEKKKNDKIKNIEKELKKKNRQIQIKLAPKQKNHRLRSADFMYDKNRNKAQLLKN